MAIRRYYIPDTPVFLTQVVDHRQPVFAETQYVDLLRGVLKHVQVLHPFAMLGYVFLPDHFHLLIQPSGQSNFSDIMHSLKSNFTREYKQLLGINGNLKFWQKRFWDSVIRDEQDFQGHLDYIHYNPVHHQYVQRPEDWLHSSFSIWQSRGIYPSGWGWTVPTTLKNDDWQLPE